MYCENLGLRSHIAWVVREFLFFLRPRSMCYVRNFSLILGIAEGTMAISFMHEFGFLSLCVEYCNVFSFFCTAASCRYVSIYLFFVCLCEKLGLWPEHGYIKCAIFWGFLVRVVYFCSGFEHCHHSNTRFDKYIIDIS